MGSLPTANHRGSVRLNNQSSRNGQEGGLSDSSDNY